MTVDSVKERQSRAMPVPPGSAALASPLQAGPSLGSYRWILRQLLRHHRGTLGLGVLVATVLVALLGPVLSPYNPLSQDLYRSLQGPSAQHLLGVDALGRDVLSRMLHGAPISLSIGLVAVALGLLIGGNLGIVAGYFGGSTEGIIMRATDVMLAFPGILMAMALVAVLGPGVLNIMIAVGVFGIPTYVRLTHGAVLTVRERLFVESARSVGAGPVRILYRHILPNIMAPLIVQSSLDVARAITVASSLSFLGLGIQPPSPEWGAMLADGREYLRAAPHVSTFPGLAVMIVVLGFNMLGDGLRDVLDPRLKGLER